MARKQNRSGGNARPRRLRRGQQAADNMPISQNIYVARNPVPARMHRFTRCSAITAATAGAADSGFNFTFTLADVENSTEFTNLFDQYRIRAVEVVLYAIPIVDTTAGQRLDPYAHFCADWDGPNTVPTSADELLQREDVHFHVFTPEKTTLSMRVNRPGTLGTILDLTATQASAMVMRSPWLNCGDPSIEHFGVPLFLSNFNTTTANSTLIRYFKRYFLEFKQSR